MTSYDPMARRDTPLALKLKDKIRKHGPIPVYEFVELCLFDAEHGYYRRQTAIGRNGDFITAPEISQTFGELIGLWAATVWQQMGAPKSFHMIEYGAGRATLMADALRAARVLPEFLESAKISLCDINPVLRQMQRATLAPLDLPEGQVRFVDGFNEDDLSAAHLAGEPAIIIANEFLDVWPPRQYTHADGGWHSRGIGLDNDGQLQFISPGAIDGADPFDSLQISSLDSRIPDAHAGAIVTVPDYAIADRMIGRWSRVAALFIDYGHEEPQEGDTLQAVRNHAFEHPLTSPGEADLTHQVDFHSFRERVQANSHNVIVDGPMTQAEFLGRLGIIQRASRLMAANPGKAAEIEAGVMRLMSPQGMGTRFKAIGVRSRGLPTLPGFE